MPPGRITPNSHVQRCRLARRAEIRDGGCTGRDPIAGSCGFQPFGETAVVGGELADTLLERGVLGGGPLNSLAGEFAFGVAGLIEQLPRCGRAGTRISAWAALRTFLALSARSALTSRPGSCSAWSRCRPTVCAVRPAGQASHVTSRRVGSYYLAARSQLVPLRPGGGLSRSPLMIEDGVHEFVCPLSLDDLVVYQARLLAHADPLHEPR